MNFSTALKDVLNRFGKNVLNNDLLLTLLAEYGIFEQNRPLKTILQIAISSNVWNQFIAHGSYDTWAIKLVKDFSDEYGFKEDIVESTFHAIGDALCWNVASASKGASPSICSTLVAKKSEETHIPNLSKSYPSEAEDIIKTICINENVALTRDLLKHGALIAKRGDVVHLIGNDGNTIINSIIPFDFSFVGDDRVVITRSEIFGYRPYDFFSEYYLGFNDCYLERIPEQYREYKCFFERYKNDLTGVISFSGETLIPFEYKYIGPFDADGYAIFNVQPSDKQILGGLLRIDGKIIIPAIYEEFVYKNNLAGGMINGEWHYFDRTGRRLFQRYDPTHLQIEENFYEVSQNKRFGVINLMEQIIVPLEFDYCFVYNSCNLIKVCRFDKYGLYNLDGVCVVDTIYDDITIDSRASLCIVKKNNLYGILNFKGEQIIPCTYDSLRIGPEINYCIRKDEETNRYGLFDTSRCYYADEIGDMVIPFIFDNPQLFCAIIAQKNGKYGIFSFEGKCISECIYDELSECVNGTCTFKIGYKIGILSAIDGELFRLPSAFKFIQCYSSLDRFVAAKDVAFQDTKCGLLDIHGNEVIEFRYDKLKFVSRDILLASFKKKKSSYSQEYLSGLISIDGRTILRIGYDTIELLSENLFLLCKNRQYSCCDRNGNIIIYSEEGFKRIFTCGNLVFAVASEGVYIFNTNGILVNKKTYEESGLGDEFHYGLFRVSRNGKYGFINNEGKEVVNCIYDDVRIIDKI